MDEEIKKEEEIEEEDIIEDYIDLSGSGGYEAMQRELRRKDIEDKNKEKK